MKNMNQAKFFTPEELADHLKLSLKTLANWRSDGSVPLAYVKFGKKVLYSSSDVEAFIESHTYNKEVS